MDPRTLIGFALALCVLAWHCSLASYEVWECERDLDCERFAEDGQRFFCQQALCVETVTCDGHSDCAAAAGESVQACVQGQCQPLLLSGACEARYPNSSEPLADDTIVLGAFAPLNSSRPSRLPVTLNYELAIDELNRSDLPYDFTLVLCDDGAAAGDGEEDLSGEAPFERGYRHLVETLQVGGLVAALPDPADVQRLGRRATARDSPLLILSPEDSIGGTKDDSSLWYLGGQPADYAPAYLELYRVAAAYLKRHGGAEPTRAAILVGEGEYFGQYADAIMNEIQVADDPPPAPRRFEGGPGEIEASLQALLQWEVELLFVLMGDDFHIALSAFEGGPSSAGAPAAEVPLCLLSSAQGDSGLLPFVVQEVPAWRARLLGLHLAEPPSAVSMAYLSRLGAKFNDAPANTGYHSRYYDAVYYLAYAAVAAAPRGGRATVDLRTGFARVALLDGEALRSEREAVAVGPEAADKVRSILADDGPGLLLQGTTGAAVFGRFSGTRSLSLVTFCPGESAEEEGGYVLRRDTQTFDAEEASFVQGAERFCFDGFWE